MLRPLADDKLAQLNSAAVTLLRMGRLRVRLSCTDRAAAGRGHQPTCAAAHALGLVRSVRRSAFVVYAQFFAQIGQPSFAVGLAHGCGLFRQQPHAARVHVGDQGFVAAIQQMLGSCRRRRQCCCRRSPCCGGDQPTMVWASQGLAARRAASKALISSLCSSVRPMSSRPLIRQCLRKGCTSKGNSLPSGLTMT